MIDLMKARLEAVARLKAKEVTDDEFCQARHAHLVTYAEYAMQQPILAAHAPAATPDMYMPVTAETALINSCGNLLTILGLTALHPDQTARITAMPAPPIAFATINPAHQGRAQTCEPCGRADRRSDVLVAVTVGVTGRR